MNARLVTLVALIAASSGCALTSKADALSIRYFTPEATGQAVASRPAAGGGEVRIGRVVAGSGLRERMAYRDGAHEVGYYEERRWTEKPEIFVKRRIERALFDEAGMKRVVFGDAPTLDVDVVAFEEVRIPGHHAVRVELRYELDDGRTSLVERTRVVELPVSENADVTEVVATLGRALDAAAAEVSQGVAAALAARPPSTSSSASR